MKVTIADEVLRHHFAIWVMGRPGWFKPQRYVYRCLQCKWAFIINDERRGSVRVATDNAGELAREDELRRIATFADGPCPGYRHVIATQELPENVIRDFRFDSPIPTRV
jgi:hypothetical protein